MSHEFDDDDSPVISQTRVGNYRPASGIVLMLTIALCFEMGLAALFGVMSLTEVTVFADEIANGDVDDPKLGMFYLAYAGLFVLYLPVYLACVILFCVWVNRSNKNARAHGADNLDFSSAWAVGCFFVPIVNLFKPFQAVREICLASDPAAGPRNWKKRSAPATLGWWWGLWIATNMLGNAEGRLSFSEDPNTMLASGWLGVVGGVLSVPSALLAVHVVRMIHQRQEEKAAQSADEWGDARFDA